MEAVFLPRLEEKELPYGNGMRGDRLAEERRLFYVGMTRAKRALTITWTAGAKPSRFLTELGVVGTAHAKAEKPAPPQSSKRYAAGEPSAQRQTRYRRTSSSTIRRSTR